MATPAAATPWFPHRTLARFVVGYLLVVAVALALPLDPTAALPAPGAAASLELPAALRAPREPAELRIVCVGASETLGFPYAPEVAFAAQLGHGLRALLPERKITAVGLGGTALDSPRIAGLAEAALASRPDLLVVVLGGNELSARIFAGKELLPDDPLGALLECLTRPRLLFARAAASSGKPVDHAALLQLVWRARPAVPALAGLPVGARDRRALARRLAQSVERIAAAAAQARVPLLFALAPHDLVGAKPHGCALAADTAWEAGRQALRAGEFAAARAHFERARDGDPAPLHRIGLFTATIQACAQPLQVPCIDLQEALAGSDGLPDPGRFLDPLHPDAQGHAAIASYLAREATGRGLLPALPAGWEARFAAATRAQLAAGLGPEAALLARLQARWSNALLHMLCGNFAAAEAPVADNLAELAGSPLTPLAERTLADMGGYVLLLAGGLSGRLAEYQREPAAALATLRQALADRLVLDWFARHARPRR